MRRTLFFHFSDAHSLCNRIELSEPRDGSRAQYPQHVKRRQFFPHSTASSLFGAIVCKAFWEKGPVRPRKELRND